MVRITRSLPPESRLLFRRLGAPPDRTPPPRQARSVALVSDDRDLLEGLRAELGDGALELVDESALDGDLGDPAGLGEVGVSPSHSGRPIMAGLPHKKKCIRDGSRVRSRSSSNTPDSMRSWM